MSKIIPIGNNVKLSQGLAINAQSKHFVAYKKNEKFPFPLLKIASMQGGEYDMFISSDAPESVVAKEDDLIFTRTGQVGEVFRGFSGVLHNNSFKVEPLGDTFDKDYLEIILKSSFIKRQISYLCSNSMQSDLTHDLFRQLLVPHFKPCQQKAISSFIKNINKKVLLNNTINAELEKLAKAIYDYWFVQFDFPDSNGKPYKASGGEMVYSKVLKREIPKGWKLKTVGDILYEIKETIKLKTDNLPSIDLSVMPNNTLCLNDRGSGSDFDANKFVLKKYDILFGSIRPYLKKAGFSPIDGLLNSSVIGLRSREEKDYSFGLCTVTSENLFSWAIKRSYGNGTRMPTISSEELLQFPIAYNANIAKLFHEKVSKFWEQIATNINQNHELTTLRDFLLPLLMNGQVTVKNDNVDERKVIPFDIDGDTAYQTFKQQVGLAARGDIDELTIQAIYKAHCEKVAENDRQRKNRKSRS